MTLAEIQADLDNRLSHARRRIPIIVVPGVMGTRLRTSRRHMVWDPPTDLETVFGIPSMDVDALAAMSTPLYPAEERTSETEYQRALTWDGSSGGLDGSVHHASRRTRRTVCAYHVRHWGGPIDAFYGDLIMRLYFDLPAALPADVMPVIYCCGYDWRQSAAHASADLATVASEAQAACGEQAIIIAHSLGGLVSRHYLRHRGGEAETRALFLFGSPTMGAPEPYLLLKRGIPDLAMRYAVVGGLNSEEGSRRVCRTMPSGYELCPNPIYCSAIDPAFAVFTPSSTGIAPTGPLEAHHSFRDASDCDRFYADIYPGVRDLTDDRAEAWRLMQNAITFHRTLIADGKVYMPPYTYAMFARDLETVVGLEFPVRARLHDPDANTNVVETDPTISLVSAHGGDSKVPTVSANPDPALLSNPFVETWELPGVEHAAMANDPGGYRFIERKLAEILSADATCG